MSEFKFACPVCGQHIKCDSSQAGTVMDCPTCFQKITVPQAPASADQKLILTGSKAGEKKPPTQIVTVPAAAPPKKSPTVLVLASVLILASATAVFLFWGKLGFLKPGWQSSDIGKPDVAGSFSKAHGTWTVTGDGADIWGQADAFRFVYQQMNGDAAITVRVVDQQNTDPWAKAGVMIRDSLDANSSYALAFVSPSSGTQFQQRNGTGNAASSVGGSGGVAPYWMRLARKGDAFTAEMSADGTSWSSLGSTTIAMDNPVYVGVAVCSHHPGTLSTATFDNVTLTGPAKKSAETNSPVAPKPVAPPANDTNWILDIGEAPVPDAPVSGRIHGHDFLIERAGFQNGTLTLREGNRGSVDFGVTINFEGAQAEALSEKTISINTNAEKAARVTLRWKDGDQAAKDSYDNGYAMRLEFGTLANNKLPGKIYLCAPDAEKSYLLGTFTANVSKPKPKAPPKQ